MSDLVVNPEDWFSHDTANFQVYRMPILFAVVARGGTVLAKYASCAGNFTEVTEQILAKIPADNSKLTYSHGR